MAARLKKMRGLVLGLLLAGATLAAYWQVRQCDFTSYDDEDYVTRNEMVRSGLTWDGIRWALTTSHFSYWHPLTWISHMLDCEWFGLDAGMHHLTNVVLHMAATLVLFLALTRMTGALECSAFVAGLFALHPLHVESVAWIAERKDVLSTLFWFLTLWAYTRYCERPSAPRYLIALILFSMGLMSKPMLVTVPFVLLLLDYWPLQRLNLFPVRSADPPESGWRGYLQAVNSRSAAPVIRLLWEKVPFLILGLASSAITVLGVWRSDRVFSVESVPMGWRLANVPISYARYLGKMLIPEDMVFLYPMPERWETWQVMGATLLLMMLTGLVLVFLKQARYLAVGWLWFLVTLLPTIGLIPVGWQSMADRYTYVPLVGLFIMMTWAALDLWGSRQQGRWVLGGAAVVILMGLAVGTWRQTGHWRNNETLFRHAVNVSTNNAIAQYNLALTLQLQGEWPEAVRHYQEAIRIDSRKDEAYNNLGHIFNQLGQYDMATNYLRKGLRVNPNNADLHLNLGHSLAGQGDPDQALAQYTEALRLDPEMADAYAYIGWLRIRQGNLREGIQNYREALRLNPALAMVHARLAWLLATHPDPAWRDNPAALAHAQQACALTQHQDPSCLLALAAAYAQNQDLPKAIDMAQQASQAANAARDKVLSDKSQRVLSRLQAGQPYVEEPEMDLAP